MESTRDLLVAAIGTLRAAGVVTPDVDAELLLAHATGRPRAMLRMTRSTATAGQCAAYAELVAKRAQRIPLQHITGLAPFRHLELRVGPGVFIPRPETELMIDHLLAFLDEQRLRLGAGAPGPVVVDLCAGSAALALAVATEAPGSRVFAVELAPEALGWAQRNIEEHADAVTRAGSTLVLVAADATSVAGPGGALEGLRGQVDAVVTNPPYVPDAAIPREAEVREHDPALALYGGPDGLEVVRPLAGQAARLLRAGGLLVVEHADVQGELGGASGVPAVLRAQFDPRDPGSTPGGRDPGQPPGRPEAQPAWQGVTDHLDLAGRPRHTTAHRARTGMLS